MDQLVTISQSITNPNLSQELKYLAAETGCSLPFLPIEGKMEIALFHQLQISKKQTDDDMCMEWMKKVDGVTIFPKLPVHMRMYREQYERFRRSAESVRSVLPERRLLSYLNERLGVSLEDFTAPIRLVNSQMDKAAKDSASSVSIAEPVVDVPQQAKQQRLPKSLRKRDKEPRKARRCSNCLAYSCEERGGVAYCKEYIPK
jgi:hypothetical protein